MTAEVGSALITADDLLVHDRRYQHGELVRGEFCALTPPGILHAWIVARIAGLLYVFLSDKPIGTVLAGDHGVLIERDPDTVRGPDLTYYSAETMPLNPNLSGFTELIPDLVVEVRSPSDSRADIHDKAMMWLSHGAGIVWVVLPETRRVDVYRRGLKTQTLNEPDDLDGGGVLPGFHCAVSSIFPAAEPGGA